MQAWGFVRQLAPLPVPVRFSSDELSMLLGPGDDNIFHLVLNMEPVHTSILETVKEYHSKRRELLNSLPVSSVHDTVASAHLNLKQITPPLQAQMNAVNGLIEQLRVHAERGFRESGQALVDLCKLLHDKLELKHRVEFPETAD